MNKDLIIKGDCRQVEIIASNDEMSLMNVGRASNMKKYQTKF